MSTQTVGNRGNNLRVSKYTLLHKNYGVIYTLAIT